VLRSALPLLPARSSSCPEIAPLGPGFADTYLGSGLRFGLFADDRDRVALHEIRHAGRFKTRNSGRSRTKLRAFHVERRTGRSKVQIPSATEDTGGSSMESARVLSSDVT